MSKKATQQELRNIERWIAQNEKTIQETEQRIDERIATMEAKKIKQKMKSL